MEQCSKFTIYFSFCQKIFKKITYLVLIYQIFDQNMKQDIDK